MAWLNVEEQHIYIHMHTTWHGMIECRGTSYIHTYTHYTTWLDQMQEKNTYTYCTHITQHGSINVGEQHIYIQYTHCTARLNWIQEHSTYTCMHTSHRMARSNVGEQHIHMHTHITPHSLIECKRTTCLHTIHIARHSLIECGRIAHILTNTHCVA